MIEALLIGTAVVSSAPWLLVGLLAAGSVDPRLGLLGVLVLVLKGRPRVMPWSREVRFCRATADELRSGSSLRRAVEIAAEDIGEHRLGRAARMSRPFVEIAARVEEALPVIGFAVGGAIRVAGESGGRVADSFEAIALIAADEEEMRNERRTATAQVRASALIIAVIPILLLGLMATTGRLSGLVAGGPLSLGFMAIGVLLIGIGLFSIWWMIRRAEVF